MKQLKIIKIKPPNQSINPTGTPFMQTAMARGRRVISTLFTNLIRYYRHHRYLFQILLILLILSLS
jgi:hypothetical protein